MFTSEYKNQSLQMKHLLFLLTLSSILLSCKNPSIDKQNDDGLNNEVKPNILVILTDDQGYHDVSYYGTKDIQTPHIDALVADGMRFDNFYANCPVCSPTRASLLAGQYPDAVGVPGVIRTNANDNWGFLSPDVELLSNRLGDLGYETALIGKWHLGLESPNTPNERGFDYFHGWLGDMMDDYWKKRRHDINYMRRNEEVIDPEGHATDLFTDWSVQYIKDQAESTDPFFLYLAYNAPHFPVQPPEEWVSIVKKREPEIDDKRAELVAFIEHLDDGIGQVVNALEQSGQYENTIIVFTSDNGGLLRDKANNGPLRDGKQSMYEGGLKVPTGIVWNNGQIEKGSVSAYKALTMDLYPTLIEAAGGSIEEPSVSKSFYPVLKGNTVDDSGRPLYFVRREGGTRYGGLTIQAVQLDGWKLLQNSPFEAQELYYLPDDPLEENNLITSASEKYKALNAILMEHIQKGGEVPWQADE